MSDPLTIATIKAAVCVEFEVDLIEMISDRRGRRVARPRQVAIYLSRRLTPLSLPSIGKRFGDRDHTTIMHSIGRIGELIASDPVFALRVMALEARLKAPAVVEHW